MSQFIKLNDKLAINVDQIEHILQQETSVGIFMTGGRVFRLENADNVAELQKLFDTAITDDPTTLDTPQTIWTTLLSYFKR